jgi:hypothetical protein
MTASAYTVHTEAALKDRGSPVQSDGSAIDAAVASPEAIHEFTLPTHQRGSHLRNSRREADCGTRAASPCMNSSGAFTKFVVALCQGAQAR